LSTDPLKDIRDIKRDTQRLLGLQQTIKTEKINNKVLNLCDKILSKYNKRVISKALKDPTKLSQLIDDIVDVKYKINTLIPNSYKKVSYYIIYLTERNFLPRQAPRFNFDIYYQDFKKGSFKDKLTKKAYFKLKVQVEDINYSFIDYAKTNKTILAIVDPTEQNVIYRRV